MKPLFRMDDMDFFEMVNHFFNREREVIQNPLAPEALPQASAPAEVAHPAPDQEERAALLRDIHTLIREQLREHCEKGKGRLSVHFPEMTEIYSSAAKAIMSYDLGISTETDTETLRRWVENLRGTLISKSHSLGNTGQISLSATFFHNRALIPGWHRSVSRGRRRCISGTGGTGQALRE